MSPLVATTMASWVRADSGPVGIAVTLALAGLLTARLFARELASPMPRLAVRTLDGSIAVLFVLFALIVSERFHVLG